MSLADWYAQEDKVLLFKQTLDNEIVQEALGVLRDHGLPVFRAVPQGTDPIQHGALLNARREGYFECLRNFHALATPPVKPEGIELQPWKKASMPTI